MAFANFNKRNALAVLIPEAMAPGAALGAVYCAATFAPDHLKAVTRIITDHVVEPHIKFFEKLSGPLRHAHEKYDREKREAMIARGEPVPDIKQSVTTPKERAHAIAGVLVKGMIAIGADFVATMAGQRFIGRAVGANISGHLPAAETGLHMLVIAAMPTVFAATAENINHGLSRRLHNSFGVPKDKAADLSVPFTYIALPGQAAALLTLVLAGTGKALAHR